MNTTELTKTYGGRWAEIKDFPGYYVSDQGQVYSDYANRLLEPSKAVDGFLVVGLCCDKKHKTYKVHRLVAEHFIPNPEDKTMITHVNGDKLDNRAVNLEWKSPKRPKYHKKEIVKMDVIQLKESYGGRWADVKDFPNYYISDQGQVFSNKIGNMMKQQKDCNGYLTVALCNNGKHKYLKVHRLVAEAFLPNPENKNIVNHKDGVKTNNTVSNLEWLSQKENVYHSIDSGLSLGRYSKERKDEARAIYKNSDYTQEELSEKFGVSLRTMQEWLKGIKKNYKDSREKDKIKAFELYKTEEYNYEDIAKILGYSASTIGYWIRKEGLSKRKTLKENQQEYNFSYFVAIPDILKDCKDELWKPIEGYPDYFVSNKGRIYSNNKRGFKKTYISHGYETIHLSYLGRAKSFYVHILVAKTFVPNLENKPFVNHVNGNKTDNRAINLEWVTHKENMRHANDSGLNPTCYSSRVKEMVIKFYKTKRYSYKDLAIIFNIPINRISIWIKDYKQSTQGPQEDQ